MTQKQVKRVFTEEEVLASSGRLLLDCIAKGYDDTSEWR
jgi:hypothetical protein